MSNSQNNNIFIVKGRFKSNSMNLFGQFYIVMNNKKFDNYNLILSTYSDAYDLEPHTDWSQYEQFIADIKWKGHFNNGMTASLMEKIKKMSEDARSSALFFKQAFEYDYENLDITLYDEINRVVQDKNLILETVIQEVSPDEFTEAKKNKKGKDSGPQPEPQPAASIPGIEKDAIVISIKPILSPVRGKPIYAIKLGDKLMVNIQPNTDKHNYVIDKLDLRQEGEVRPTTAKVIDIKSGADRNDPTKITVELHPGIYGEFFEDEKQVKLKIYDPEIDGPLVQKTVKPEELSSENQLFEDDTKRRLPGGTIIMLIMFVTILILFIFLILLNW